MKITLGFQHHGSEFAVVRVQLRTFLLLVVIIIITTYDWMLLKLLIMFYLDGLFSRCWALLLVQDGVPLIFHKRRIVLHAQLAALDIPLVPPREHVPYDEAH